VLVVLVGAGFAFLSWSPLAERLSWVEITATFDHLRGTWWAPALLIAAYILLCPLGFPATPLMIAGGMVFGTVLGSVYNVTGIFLGGAASYYMGLLLGRDFVLHFGGRRMRQVEEVLAREGGFWSLVGIRFLPLPFALVNYCAALGGIRPGLFLSSTALGLVLTVPFFTYFADTLSNAASGERSQVFLQLAVAMALLALVTILPRLWIARRRRKTNTE